MNVRFRRFAAVIAVTILVSTASAQASTVWYQGSVQLVYPMNDGSFAIGVPTILPVCSGTGQNGVYLYVMPEQNSVTADGAKNMLATVLTAFALGRSISVAYDDSTTNCYANRLLIQ